MEPLKKAKNFKGPEGPVVLAILDGIGIGTCKEGEVVSRANTPTLDGLAQNAPGHDDNNHRRHRHRYCRRRHDTLYSQIQGRISKRLQSSFKQISSL